MKIKWRKALSVVMVAVCVFSTTMLLKLHSDGKRESESQAMAAELALNTPKETASPEPVFPQAKKDAASGEEKVINEPGWVPMPVEDPEMELLAAINLDALREVNPDVVGWIRIPGTGIDFPITQGADNEFYLEHSWDKTPNQYGAIFLEHMNDPDMTEFNTIIYGHRMNDGSMFAPLLKYAEASFLREHPYIYLVTDTGVLRYEVFSSYTVDVDSDAYGLGMQQEQTKRNYIADAVDYSDVDTGLVPAFTDRILTLSTCTRGSFESRRVVHAYLPMVYETP